MIKQGFSIGDRDWYVMCYYDITRNNIPDIEEVLISAGCKEMKVVEAIETLSQRNTGMTFTNYREHLSVVLISEADTTEQIYDTIQHELKHLTEHIGEYYGVYPMSEESAYLQGELSRKMFPAVALAICPHCN